MITRLRYPCWLHWPFRLVSGAVITASALLSGAAHAANHVEALVDPDFGRLTIIWEGDYTEAEKSKLAEWQSAVATVMAGIYGELPGGSVKVVLQRYPATEAVPFARVIRGGNERLLFYVNPDYPLAEFVNDWTAYHEYTHLFIPFPGRADIWFSEGLASYYQNLLLYRAGVLSEEQAWQKLYAGFRRGQADDGYADLSLKELSKDMRETHAYMRIYWSGALYFLEAELRLREATDLDLGQVLQRFNDCCRDKQNSSGLAIAEAFDRVAATSIFVPLYKRYEKSLAIPDFVAALAAAGLTVDEEQVYISGESTLWSSH